MRRNEPKVTVEPVVPQVSFLRSTLPVAEKLMFLDTVTESYMYCGEPRKWKQLDPEIEERLISDPIFQRHAKAAIYLYNSTFGREVPFRNGIPPKVLAVLESLREKEIPVLGKAQVGRNTEGTSTQAKKRANNL